MAALASFSAILKISTASALPLPATSSSSPGRRDGRHVEIDVGDLAFVFQVLLAWTTLSMPVP